MMNGTNPAAPAKSEPKSDAKPDAKIDTKVKPKFTIVTDSTCDIPPAMAAERDIFITPLHITWGDQVYADGIDITAEAFYKRLPGSAVLPKTSQPSPGEFAEKYRLAREKTGAESVLCITISRDLSGTYASAESARSLVDFPVKVVDSRTATLALGYTALVVADARDKGVTLEEAGVLAEETAKKTHILFLVNTLEYLHRGGRIGGAQRFIGTALSIKPILHVKDGKVAALESVRSRKKSVARLLELVKERATGRPLKIGIVHSNVPELDEIRGGIEAALNPDQMIVELASPVIGVHIGTEAVGVIVMNG